MTKDEIIEMAKQCELVAGNAEHGIYLMALQRFAALVAEKEREACAKECEGRIGGAVQTNDWWFGFRSAMKQCAAAIRARKL